MTHITKPGAHYVSAPCEATEKKGLLRRENNVPRGEKGVSRREKKDDQKRKIGYREEEKGGTVKRKRGCQEEKEGVSRKEIVLWGHYTNPPLSSGSKLLREPLLLWAPSM